MPPGGFCVTNDDVLISRDRPIYCCEFFILRGSMHGFGSA